MPLVEEGSTDKIRRYTASSDEEGEEGTMTVCFDAATFFLSSIEAVDGDGSKMSITATDTVIVEEFAEGHFTFSGEAQDVTAMLGMMGGGGPAAPADDDLEF
jgi:outer membrane lipoprotein-sorting protein